MHRVPRTLLLANFDLGLPDVPLHVRLEAASAGGFDGIGLNVAE